ncbi:MAG: DUF192 domain-containing protein [bacterium]
MQLKYSFKPALWAMILLLTSFALAGCTHDSSPVVVLHTELGDISIRVEVATSPGQLQRGLMWRSEMADDEGMLFVFAEEKPRSFWMKNTPLSLDIIFFDSSGKLVSIAPDTRPYSERSIASGAPARYVLEVVAGFCSRHGLRVGDRATLPPGLPGGPGGGPYTRP